MPINYYSIIPALALVCNGSLAVYILLKNSKDRLSRLYSSVTFCLFIWSVGEFLLFSGFIRSDNAAILVYDFLMIGVSLICPFLLNFVLVFAKKEKILSRKTTYLWLYFPSAIVVLLIWFTDLLFSRHPVALAIGYAREVGPFFGAYLLIIFPYYLLACYYLWRFYRETTEQRQKKQAKYSLLAFLFTGIFGFVADGILRVSGITDIAQATIFCSIFSFALIAYAMVRYGFFTITAQLAAETIVRVMPDFLLVLDGSLNVSFANSRVYDVLGYKEKDLKGKPFEAILSDGDGIAGLKEAVLRSPVSDYEIRYLAKDGKKVPVSLSSFPLEEAGGRVLGVVTVARDMRQTQEFIRRLEEDKAEIEKRGGELEKSRERMEEKNAELEGLNKELEGKYGEIERFNKLMMGREVKMMDLKKENAELRAKLGQS